MNDQFEQDYARYIGNEMSSGERREFEEKVLANPELSAEVYADLNVASRLETTKIVRMPTRWWRWAAPLAAAAVIVMGLNLLQPSDEPADPVMRGSTTAVELLGPSGILETVPARFEWSAVEGADRYRFELMDDQARTVNRTVVSQTFLILETGVPAIGAWRVVALDDLGQELASSAPETFEVRP